MLILPYKPHVVYTSPPSPPFLSTLMLCHYPLPHAASAILTSLLILKNAQHLAALGPSCLEVLSSWSTFSQISTGLSSHHIIIVLWWFSLVWLLQPMDCSLPCSSVHRILQARVLEWVAISFSKGSSCPRD